MTSIVSSRIRAQFMVKTPDCLAERQTEELSTFSLQWYLDIRNAVADAGYRTEYEWSESLQPVTSPDGFALEACWVVLNAGMKEQVARTIWERVRPQLEAGLPLAFRHQGKRLAMWLIWDQRRSLFEAWERNGRSVHWLASLPWIGQITKWHLAKNLGVDCCKPDRHLVRLAKRTGETPAGLCERLSKLSGDRISTVDVILWRAANLGLMAEAAKGAEGEPDVSHL